MEFPRSGTRGIVPGNGGGTIGDIGCLLVIDGGIDLLDGEREPLAKVRIVGDEADLGRVGRDVAIEAPLIVGKFPPLAVGQDIESVGVVEVESARDAESPAVGGAEGEERIIVMKIVADATRVKDFVAGARGDGDGVEATIGHEDRVGSMGSDEGVARGSGAEGVFGIALDGVDVLSAGEQAGQVEGMGGCLLILPVDFVVGIAHAVGGRRRSIGPVEGGAGGGNVACRGADDGRVFPKDAVLKREIVIEIDMEEAIRTIDIIVASGLAPIAPAAGVVGVGRGFKRQVIILREITGSDEIVGSFVGGVEVEITPLHREVVGIGTRRVVDRVAVAGIDGVVLRGIAVGNQKEHALVVGKTEKVLLVAHASDDVVGDIVTVKGIVAEVGKGDGWGGGSDGLNRIVVTEIVDRPLRGIGLVVIPGEL